MVGHGTGLGAHGLVTGEPRAPQGGEAAGGHGLRQLSLHPATPCHPSADPIHPPIQLPGDSRCGLLS